MPVIIQQYWNDFVALFYPHNCPGCGNEMNNTSQKICWKCTTHLPVTNFEKYRNNPIERMFSGRLPFEMATAFLFFQKGSLAQQLVHQIKYKGNKELGVAMGKMMGYAMKEAGWGAVIDTVVPLPLNKKKEAKRGFNQSALLAEGICTQLNKPMNEMYITRIKNTQTQTKKNRTERWQNVEDIFSLKNKSMLENKHALLVDDVVTTGATIESCGQVLQQINGLTLSIATLAFASKI